VHDPARVGAGEGARDLDGVRDRLLDRQTAIAPDPLLERLSGTNSKTM
jgi:hypothetical protein